MKLIAGLGNPGEKYRYTRHNAGFLILDYIAGSLNLNFDIKTPSYEAAASHDGDSGFIMLKPMTYMNRSGKAILKFMSEYRGKISDILIVIDDFNLPLGTIRVRRQGSDGGHNGLADIISMFATDEFPRMRVGIGPEELIPKEDYVDFVLKDFTPAEMNVFEKMMPHYKDCIMSFVNDGLIKTMNSLNRSFLDEINKDN